MRARPRAAPLRPLREVLILDPMERGLANLLRTRTHSLHVQAEQSGIIVEILRGRASRDGYALWLRNLLPAYQCLESGLERHREAAGVRAVALPAIYRSSTLESDLEALQGRDWRRSLPLLPSGDRYARRVSEAADGDGSGLLGHSYARYLGDLSGGRILLRVLSRSLDLDARALSFYAYPGIADLDEFRARYRDAFDAAADFVDAERVVDEALAAFRHNIEVSEEVRRVAAGRSS